MEKYIIALDEGTTSARAVLFDNKLNICGTSQKEFTQIYPKSGWVEHDPIEIYSAQYGVFVDLLEKTNVKPEQIVTIGITNQRETTVVWNKNTGKPIYNAIVWQCRRTSDYCTSIKGTELEKYIKRNTGLIPDAYFSATKIKWILDNVPDAREMANKGELLFGTIDTWILWKLTDGRSFKTDETNAARTMIYNILEHKWDKHLLEEFDIPESMLPEVMYSGDDFGYFEYKNVKIPINGMAGDQQSSLFGHCCFEPGSMKNTYGTGCFALVNTGTKAVRSKNGLVTTCAATLKGEHQYALEGSVFTGGSVIQWLRDEMQLIKTAAESEECAMKVDSTNGVYIVPAFTGLGAPYWNMYARGTIFGLTRGANKNHIIRAALESIAFQSKDVLETMMKEVGIKPDELHVDGGATINNFLMQFQADITGVTIARPKVLETTAKGVAMLAGLYTGFFKDAKECEAVNEINKCFVPEMPKEKVDELVGNWNKAVWRSFNWEESPKK